MPLLNRCKPLEPCRQCGDFLHCLAPFCGGKLNTLRGDPPPVLIVKGEGKKAGKRMPRWPDSYGPTIEPRKR